MKRKRDGESDTRSPDNLESEQADTLLSLIHVSSKRKKLLIQKTNSRYWSHLRKKCTGWVKKTAPTEPSFCLLYWRSVRGHNEIVWEGPEHMRSFVENSLVMEEFKKSALSKAALTSSRQSDVLANPMTLNSTNPADYRNDVLAKIIPSILNPLGLRNFYSDISNCPAWFPKDSVEFKRPNHPKRGQKRMTATEMRKIFQAFLDNCPLSYEIIATNEATSNSGSVDGTEKRDDGDDTIATVECPLREVETIATIECPLREVEINVTTKDALKGLKRKKHWDEFVQQAREIGGKTDLSFLSECHIQCIEDVNDKIDWRRKQVLKKKIPAGFIPCVTTAEGDCLFCAVNLSLFGSEDRHIDLRFAVVHHAVFHFDEYLKMLMKEISTIEDAQQFLCTVASTDMQFQQQPVNASVQDLLEYTLRTEIMGTATIGSYSGLLQILFVAGVMHFGIKQHCEVDRDGYDTTLFPIVGAIRGTIHIMWVKPDAAAAQNHIIPLLRNKNDLEISQTSFQCQHNSSFIHKSLQFNICYFCAHSPVKTGDKSMVQCEVCSKWFHCICIGVSVEHFTNGQTFICCKSPTPQNDFQVVGIQRGGKMAVIRFADVFTLYPNKGISDAIINFFIWIMLPQQATAMTISALGYTAATTKTSAEEKRKVFTAANGQLDIDQPLLLFPCCIQAIWHWILIAVFIQEEMSGAFVMDSMSPKALSSHSKEAVANVSSLLQCWRPNLSLKALTYQVPYQEGVDCGLHVMSHVRAICENPPKALLENGELLKSPVNASLLRKEILAECWKLSVLKKTKRCSESEIKRKKLADLTKIILERDFSGLKVVNIRGKGKGVITTKKYMKGEYICEYEGDLITYGKAQKREEEYLEDKKGRAYKGYLFYFTFKNKKLCIDATKESGKIGRMVNHSKKYPNIMPQIVSIDETPHTCFFARVDIASGTELLYDYGDRSSAAINAHPWLAK